ncbi:GNAT family N-acetyltransferase [Morganella morganii]|nr:GNAT family N-acetyltransferase [Morganella morganii]
MTFPWISSSTLQQKILCTIKMKLKILRHLDKDYQIIIENEFIKKKNRSGKINNYFKIFNEDNFEVFLLTDNNENLIAGLTAYYPKNTFQYAEIGLVIVNDRFRGFGYSHQLLKMSIEYINKKFKDIVLWTSKHGVYKKIGFNIEDNTRYLNFENSGTHNHINYTDIQVETKIRPLYSTSTGMLKTGKHRVYYIDDGNSPIYYDYKGNVDAAIEIILAHNKRIGRLYMHRDDPIFPKFTNLIKNWSDSVDKYEMWLHRNTEKNNIHVKFINRI